MTITILSKCPFCGGEAHVFPYDPYGGYQGDCTSYIVKCKECRAEIKRRTEKEAALAWNKRDK